MSEKETVEVTVNLPKGLIQFLEDIIPSTDYENVKNYLEDAIISKVEGDIEGDIFNPNLKSVAEKYDLKEVFAVKD